MDGVAGKLKNSARILSWGIFFCKKTEIRIAVGYTDEVGVTIPPLHPRCRCSIMYDEVETPRALRPKPLNPLAAPPTASDNSSGSKNLLTALPKGVGLCKIFDEAKLYWAENYNVKVADEIKTLHFESVRAAMSGVEAVLEEFLPAGFFLEEFGINKSGLMNVSDGYRKINFNAKYFSAVEFLAHEFKSGYYIKNMSAFGAGAHEAGHLIEKWLIENGNNIEELIIAAYGAALRTSGKFKPLEQFRREISPHAFQESLSECLADVAADYLVNKEQAAHLSKAMWQILKEKVK